MLRVWSQQGQAWATSALRAAAAAQPSSQGPGPPSDILRRMQRWSSPGSPDGDPSAVTCKVNMSDLDAETAVPTSEEVFHLSSLAGRTSLFSVGGRLVRLRTVGVGVCWGRRPAWTQPWTQRGRHFPIRLPFTTASQQVLSLQSDQDSGVSENWISSERELSSV